MKKYILTITIIVVGLIYYFLSEPWPGDVVETFEITEGHLSKFKIGDQKQSLLNLSDNHFFSVISNTQNCKSNWVELATMSLAEEKCLQESDEWQVGGPIETPCPDNTDYFVNLTFANNAISKIVVKCSKPI